MRAAAWVASSSVGNGEREGEKLINTCLGTDRREESSQASSVLKAQEQGPAPTGVGVEFAMLNTLVVVGAASAVRTESDPVCQACERPCPRGAPSLGGPRSRGPRGPAADAEGKQTEGAGWSPD